MTATLRQLLPDRLTLHGLSSTKTKESRPRESSSASSRIESDFSFQLILVATKLIQGQCQVCCANLKCLANVCLIVLGDDGEQDATRRITA